MLNAAVTLCTDDVLEDMPYADAVIKEVMRLLGIVDGIWRQTLEDITIQGHQIPKVRHQDSPVMTSAQGDQCDVMASESGISQVSTLRKSLVPDLDSFQLVSSCGYGCS